MLKIDKHDKPKNDHFTKRWKKNCLLNQSVKHNHFTKRWKEQPFIKSKCKKRSFATNTFFRITFQNNMFGVSLKFIISSGKFYD